ncbi:hypothetical protein [Bacillus sp. 03113]|uniref:hypothetical protein n=1 Tax=Bacillus sp. 03113 TaxID=2578211 RepID=UPI001144EA2E|nr:hypothetical protein [Bacillus sp. 03113]
MKRQLLFSFAAFFILSLFAITGASAVEEPNLSIMVSQDKVDITGDGKIDIVTIKGIRFDQNTKFLKKVFLDITESNGKTYKEELEGGYEPKIVYDDLNHDGVKDMFITIPTGGSGGMSNFYLFTLKDFILTNLTLPKPLIINGQFQNDYKAMI